MCQNLGPSCVTEFRCTSNRRGHGEFFRFVRYLVVFVNVAVGFEDEVNIQHTYLYIDTARIANDSSCINIFCEHTASQADMV